MATIQSLHVTRRYEPLAPPVLDRIHGEALSVLERVGIALEKPELQNRLAACGARVEPEKGRVRFSADLIETGLRSVPDRVVLYGRRDGADLDLTSGHSYLSVDGCAAEVLDPRTGTKRPSCKQDLSWITRVADQLPQIALVWQPVAARDVPSATAPLHELHAQVAATDKHIQMMTAAEPTAAEGVVQIARAVAGGAEALRQRPFLSSFQCSLSPLSYEAGAIEAALVFARAGIPCGFVVMPISCASAPASPLGTLIIAHAELLAGITVLQLLAPGTPTFYGSCATTMDLVTGAAACGGPEDLLYQCATAQLAHRLGVPACVGTFATGAKRPDWQAGVEDGLSGLISALTGAELMCGAGLLYGAKVYSGEQLLLDAEIFRLLSAMLAPEALTDGTALVDLIESVGPGGHFLDRDHTLENMQRFWMPNVFDRRSWDEAASSGWPGPADEAHERLLALMEPTAEARIPETVDEQIRAILAEYDDRVAEPARG